MARQLDSSHLGRLPIGAALAAALRDKRLAPEVPSEEGHDAAPSRRVALRAHFKSPYAAQLRLPADAAQDQRLQPDSGRGGNACEAYEAPQVSQDHTETFYVKFVIT